MSFDLLRRRSRLWRHAQFNRLWAAQALSAFGSRITRTAIPIIAVAMLEATPAQAAILAALSYAPYLVAGLIGGGFVERSNKLKLMVAMDIVRFVIVIAAPIAFVLGWLSFPLLCVMATLAGAASAIFQNADVAILPCVVNKDDLVDANSRLQATESIAELTGPGAAGLLIDLLTAPIAMVADAFTFLWSAFWLSRIPKEVGVPAAEAKAEGEAHEPVLVRLREDMAVGFRAIMGQPALRAILGATAFWYLSAGFFFATFTIFMLRVLGLSPTVMGVIISFGGASALAGAVLARPLAKAVGFGPALVLGFVLSVAGALMLIPAAWLPQWSVAFLIAQQLLGDGGIMIFTVLAISLQQKLLPESEIARANGLNQAVAGVVMTVSVLAAGAVAEIIGVSNTVMLGAGVCLLGVFPLLTRVLLGMREEPEPPVLPDTLAVSSRP